MSPVIPLELQFLCSLVRPQPDLPKTQKLLQSVDVGQVIQLAAAHGVRPHMVRALEGGALCMKLLRLKAHLDDFKHSQSLRSLYLSEELLRISDVFRRNDVTFATFKGIILAHFLYGDVAMRECSDIDIIVRSEHMAAAERALASSGYREASGRNSEWRHTFLGYHCQYLYRNIKTNLPIDLHWALQRGSSYLPDENFWDTVKEVNVAGHKIPALGTEQLGIYLAAHGAKEHWRRLGWICDYAELYVRRTEIDWIGLLDKLGRTRRRQVLLALLLIHRVLDVPVGGKLVRAALGDRNVVQNANRVVKRMVGTSDGSRTMGSTHAPPMCANWAARVMSFWLLLATRTTGDYNAMPLPKPLWRLYHVVRPVRLTAKLLSAFPALFRSQQRI